MSAAWTRQSSIPTQISTPCRYNHAMRPRIAESPPRSLMFGLKSALIFVLTITVLTFAPACTFYGEHPARSFSEATGGEGLERVFWKNVQAANWVEVERALASNYAGVTPSGTLDRSTTLEQYRSWQLKDYTLGDLTTQLNATTTAVTSIITLPAFTSHPTPASHPPSSPPP